MTAARAVIGFGQKYRHVLILDSNMYGQKIILFRSLTVVHQTLKIFSLSAIPAIHRSVMRGGGRGLVRRRFELAAAI
jgi:hypothetical protein